MNRLKENKSALIIEYVAEPSKWAMKAVYLFYYLYFFVFIQQFILSCVKTIVLMYDSVINKMSILKQKIYYNTKKY